MIFCHKKKDTIGTHSVDIRQWFLELAGVLHDGLECGQLLPHLEDLLQLHVVLRDDDVRVTVAGHVLAGFRGVGRVDAYRETAARGKNAG